MVSILQRFIDTIPSHDTIINIYSRGTSVFFTKFNLYIFQNVIFKKFSLENLVFEMLIKIKFD